MSSNMRGMSILRTELHSYMAGFVLT